MNKRPFFIITIMSLAIATILSLASCTPNEPVSAAPMMDDHEAQLPIDSDDHHHDDTDDHHEEVDDHHEEMDDHHDEEIDDHMDSDDGHAHDGDEKFSSTPVLDNAREITVVADEFSFEPAEITLQEGEAINITFINEGQLPHELSIEALNFHLHVEGGETVRGGLIAGEAGTYEIGCFIAGHYEAGMFGELNVSH